MDYQNNNQESQYQQPQQPQYQQPQYQQPMYAPATPNEMTVGDWMLTLFLMWIPIVNLICLIVWAVSSSPDKRSRKNWAIATFIWALIGIVIGIVFSAILGAAITSMFY